MIISGRDCSLGVAIDVKNIDLQKHFFTFIKKNIIKNMHKNIKLQMFSIATFFAIIHAKNI